MGVGCVGPLVWLLQMPYPPSAARQESPQIPVSHSSAAPHRSCAPAPRCGCAGPRCAWVYCCWSPGASRCAAGFALGFESVLGLRLIRVKSEAVRPSASRCCCLAAPQLAELSPSQSLRHAPAYCLAMLRRCWAAGCTTWQRRGRCNKSTAARRWSGRVRQGGAVPFFAFYVH